MVEQRYLAVREVLDGARVTDVATRYGVDRRTVHRWLVRYASEGLGALADRSSRPDRCPHQIAPEVEARIVALRRSHPGWGPRTILSKLRREPAEPPSRSSIYRCLVRHRLIDPKPRRRRPSDYKRWERSRPMELWQMDVMGGVILADVTELKAITGIDDHSRFCVMAKLVPRATARPVCFELVQRSTAEVVDPDEGTQDAPRPSGHSVARRVDRAGRISILKHRYHVGRHLAGQRVAVESVDGLLHVTHDGVLVATHARRHLPEDDARMDRRAKAARPARPTAGGEVLRKVDPSGSVSFAGAGYRVGNRYVGHVVGVRVVADTVQIAQDGLLLRTHRARHFRSTYTSLGPFTMTSLTSGP